MHEEVTQLHDDSDDNRQTPRQQNEENCTRPGIRIGNP